ncbi:hypothetical protein [Haloprofundus sp. MHR1]|uniref:WD40/YVTN/BNR-like repeat-containing protein n=1 Tax=Haloprofundus sp. MHR1 TaxID=2572921 RepID=UPI0010BEEAAB|nr:hypothetical protein [Haloprofundus sp. MHR1]QCJ46684.1 hypothetical protein FCF25_05920 [Haloprofundus sp. MHR1]
MSSNGRVRDFSQFYREYARGGVHAASAAAMTAFGLLTIYHEAFALLAVVSYVGPALYVYAERDGDAEPEPEPGRNAEPEARQSDPSPTAKPSELDARSASRSENVDRESDESGARRDRTDPRPPPSTAATLNDSDADGGGERGDVSDDVEGGEPDRKGESDATTEDDGAWTSVDSPVGVDFSDAVATEEAVYAVGEDGYVLARGDGGWSAVLETGPGAQGENLTGVDVTDDGRAVWVAGDGGALGRIDAESGRHTDYSAPGGDTSTITDLAVTGRADEAVVVLVNGSGEVRRGEYDGRRVRWGEPQKPGSGSSFAAVAFGDAERGYLADTNGSVFQTTDGGETFDEIGIDGAGTLTALVPVSGEGSNTEAFAAEDDGTIHRYDGTRWTPVRPTEEGLWAIAAERGERVVAVGEHGTALDGDEGDWQRRETPTDETLRGVCVAADRQVAVGDDGVVLERRATRRASEQPR